MIRFSGFEKHYDQRLIISADLKLPHAAYWLKGQNGSGKTTLIKSIAGLIPFKGEIIVDDISIRRDARKYRNIVNYAEAEPIYPEFLTGQDLLSFYLEAKGGNISIAEQLIADLGINTYIRNKVGTYSSGMAKKLSLALAFIGQARLILLDEPLITLDQNSISILSTIIKDHYDNGVSFLITSHQMLQLPGMVPVPLVVEGSALKPAPAP